MIEAVVRSCRQLPQTGLLDHERGNARPTVAVGRSRTCTWRHQADRTIGTPRVCSIAGVAVWTGGMSPQFRDTARLCLEALERSLAAARRLIQEQTPLCFCRSDARFANVIARTDGRLGLVDWEDSGLRDPAREVANLLMHPNQEDLLDWDTWQACLSICGDSRRDDLPPSVTCSRVCLGSSNAVAHLCSTVDAHQPGRGQTCDGTRVKLS